MKKVIFRVFTAFFLVLPVFLQAQDTNMRLEDLRAETEFMLVVDRSGSMYGQAMEDAKQAVQSFIRDMRTGDKAALIEFSTGIRVSQRLTSDKSALSRAASRISADGGTQLYDAVGRALMESRNSSAVTVIIFMTDGQDNASSMRASDLANMCPSQGVFVYGIGLGDVDQTALRSIASATGGKWEYTSRSSELNSIYQRVLRTYYSTVGQSLRENSQMVIRSLPKGQPVFLNDNRIGQTPLLVSGLKQGNYRVRVDFRQGKWEKSFMLPGGKRGYIDARESDIPKNIAVLSVPHNGMVFLDGQFSGYTSAFLTKKTTTTKGWLFKKEIINEDFSRELIITAVPKGQHNLRIVAISDDELQSFFQPIDYNFYMGEQNLIISADCRTGEVETTEYKKELKPSGRRPIDPFEELDDDMDMDDF